MACYYTGSIQSAHCPGEGNIAEIGLAYRRCLAGEWGSVDASECESVAGKKVRTKVEQLCHNYARAMESV